MATTPQTLQISWNLDEPSDEVVCVIPPSESQTVEKQQQTEQEIEKIFYALRRTGTATV